MSLESQLESSCLDKHTSSEVGSIIFSGAVLTTVVLLYKHYVSVEALHPMNGVGFRNFFLDLIQFGTIKQHKVGVQ